jgi:hypothetical protein
MEQGVARDCWIIGLINNTVGVLHPVSIHLVPASESKTLTLVAITPVADCNTIYPC